MNSERTLLVTQSNATRHIQRVDAPNVDLCTTVDVIARGLIGSGIKPAAVLSTRCNKYLQV